jgi:hypothetical protein
MEAICASETLAQMPSTTRSIHPRYEVTSTVNHRESLKSVMNRQVNKIKPPYLALPSLILLIHVVIVWYSLHSAFLKCGNLSKHNVNAKFYTHTYACGEEER